MIVKNANQVHAIYIKYGRGWISWTDAIAKLIELGVPATQAPNVLLGTELIAGY